MSNNPVNKSVILLFFYLLSDFGCFHQKTKKINSSMKVAYRKCSNQTLPAVTCARSRLLVFRVLVRMVTGRWTSLASRKSTSFRQEQGEKQIYLLPFNTEVQCCCGYVVGEKMKSSPTSERGKRSRNFSMRKLL